MADSHSPKGSGFSRKVQRQLSRGKEKVLQKLGKTVETKDDLFDQFLHNFYDQQTDGNRLHKDLRAYLNAVRDMREASRRLSQSLFDVYEVDWVGEEDLGAIVEGEDLLWNDFEVKLLDQAIRTMESYVSQFPDVREKIAKRGRKLVDYDSARHHLEALQSAKKKDDIKINKGVRTRNSPDTLKLLILERYRGHCDGKKMYHDAPIQPLGHKKAEEEMNAAKAVYEGINNDLKEELPVLYDSRIGCYVAAFLAVSNLRDTFYKEVSVLNQDLHNVISELQAQHPDKQFSVKGIQRYGSLKRRSLMSPRAWKASFNEFHRSYNPKVGPRFSFKSPEKPKHGTLSRESSAIAVSPQPTIMEDSAPESTDPDTAGSHSESDTTQTQDAAASSEKPSSDKESSPVEDKAPEKEEEMPAESENTEEEAGEQEKAPQSDSSSEVDPSCDSVSLELQLSAADHSPLHIEEEERAPDTPKTNGLENGEVSGLSTSLKDVGLEQPQSQDSKSTTV